MNKSTSTAYIDIQQLVLMTILLICIIAIKAMQPPAHSATIDGDMIIVMTWAEVPPTDMDLWLKTPNDDQAVGFRRTQGVSASLGHDDIGNDDVHIEHRRFEKIVVRGLPAGEYIVNVHSYSKFMPCTVQIEAQLKDTQTGLVSTIWKQSATFDNLGDERTIARFKLDASGRYLADSFNTIPIKIVTW